MMNKVLSGLLLSLGTFIVFSLVVTPPAQARQCGKQFQVQRSAGSKLLTNARKFANLKAWKAARRRCGASRVATRGTAEWQYQCSKRGTLNRCVASSTFRCCSTGKITRKRTKRTKRIVRRTKRTKRRSKRIARRSKRRTKRRIKLGKRSLKRRSKRTARRSKRRTKRSKRVARRSKRSAKQSFCMAKVKVQGRALSAKKIIAQKVARSRVYNNAKLRCKNRFPQYVSRWQYTCTRDGKAFSCAATNMVRCCSKRIKRNKRLTRRSKRRSKRRTKRRSKRRRTKKRLTQQVKPAVIKKPAN